MRIVRESERFHHLTLKWMRCMFSRSGLEFGSLLPHATAFGDLAGRPIQKRWE
jgi:hypothetical protein